MAENIIAKYPSTHFSKVANAEKKKEGAGSTPDLQRALLAEPLNGETSDWWCFKQQCGY